MGRLSKRRGNGEKKGEGGGRGRERGVGLGVSIEEEGFFDMFRSYICRALLHTRGARYIYVKSTAPAVFGSQLVKFPMMVVGL